MSWLEIGIITFIFTYALWMVIRHVCKTKQGACASCAWKRSCSSACTFSTRKQKEQQARLPDKDTTPIEP